MTLGNPFYASNYNVIDRKTHNVELLVELVNS